MIPRRSETRIFYPDARAQPPWPALAQAVRKWQSKATTCSCPAVGTSISTSCPSTSSRESSSSRATKSSHAEVSRTDRSAARTLGLSPRRKSEEQLEPLVDCLELVLRDPSEDAADAPLVDGPQVVDEGVRPLRETARPGGQLRIESAFAGCSRDRHDGDEREALVGVHRRIAHGDAWAKAALLVVEGRVELDED